MLDLHSKYCYMHVGPVGVTYSGCRGPAAPVAAASASNCPAHGPYAIDAPAVVRTASILPGDSLPIGIPVADIAASLGWMQEDEESRPHIQ